MVEMLDDRHLGTGRSQSNQPLVGIAQKRRGKAEDYFLRVGVERDDGGFGPRTLGGATKLPEQVQMAAVEAVEDAHGNV
jgi:hypothetical protein